jgi:hypothetical protein
MRVRIALSCVCCGRRLGARGRGGEGRGRERSGCGPGCGEGRSCAWPVVHISEVEGAGCIACFRRADVLRPRRHRLPGAQSKEIGDRPPAALCLVSALSASQPQRRRPSKVAVGCRCVFSFVFLPRGAAPLWCRFILSSIGRRRYRRIAAHSRSTDVEAMLAWLMVATDTPDAATDDACGSGGSSGGGAGPSTSGAPERPGSGSGSGSSGGGGGGGSVWRRQAPLLRKLALLSDAGWWVAPPCAPLPRLCCARCCVC